jgi:hypothetical protein
MTTLVILRIFPEVIVAGLFTLAVQDSARTHLVVERIEEVIKQWMTSTGNNICQGTKRDGSPCTFRAIEGTRCRIHARNLTM